MKQSIKTILFIFFVCAAVVATAQTFPSNISTGHPRIWWNAQRLTQAQQWFATHPFTPNSDTDPVNSNSDPTGNALRYILTGNITNARVAIDWALNAINTMPDAAFTCDQCRWYGEEALIAYDWCYDQMTPAERNTFTTKMNQVVAGANASTWGNNNPESNYFWGYMRISLLWGVASYWENTTNATTFINNALQTKWDGLFKPYATNHAPGGIPAEGVDYGYTVETYPVVPFETMNVYGRDLYAETDYFKRAVFNNIYSALPDLTYDNPGRSTPGKSWFPFGDSGDFLVAQDPILRSGAKDFMKYAAGRWSSIRIGQYARKWLSWLNASFPKLYDAADPGGAEADFSSLPLDYYSTGEVGHAFTRTQWGPQATVAHIQLSSPPVIGHEHFDAGNWQIWRNQRFLSRESPGRGVGSGYSYVGYNAGDRVDAESSINHNVLLFGGQGHGSGSDIPSTVGTAEVLRMETTSSYFYSAVDVTPSYKNSNGDNAAWSNQNVSHAEREFIFIRPLETLFIFDRMESVSTANTTKTFLAHFQNQPVLDGNQTYLSVNGDQAFRLQTLLPATPSAYRLIDEQSSVVAQTGSPYRLEVETSGTGTQYFMHVAQARDAADANVTASVTDNGSTYTVTLVHPTKGNVKIILNKGLHTSGGSFGFSATGIPTETSPLRTTVQGIAMTDDGPVWEGTTSCSYAISPTSVSTGAAASTGSIAVTAGTTCSWTATSSVPWLAISGTASGIGNGTVNYAIAANAGAARTGTITIAGQTFTVSQAVSPCAATLSPTNTSFSASAASGSVGVSLGSSCTWTATESLSWVAITSGASGTGNGTVSYTVTENTGPARNGVITIAGQSFTIHQDAAGGGILVDYYINETTPTVSFINGVGTAAVAAEGLGASNCLKFSDLDTWDKTRRVHYATPKDISSVVATDVLRISIDMTPGTPSTYLQVTFNEQWDIVVNTPVIDNVPGFQTFDISLSDIREVLGNTVNDIYFLAGDGFPAGVTLRVDEIRFVRPTPAFSAAAQARAAGLLEDADFAEVASVYPNPAQNELHIALAQPLSGPTELKMIDALGKTVRASRLPAGTQSWLIHTQDLTPGIYSIQLRVPGGVVRKKVMIVKD